MNIGRNQYKLIILFLFISTGWMACRVGREYQRPALELPSHFNNETTADTSSIATIKWSSFFKDTTLLQLINEGIAHNYDLQIAIKRIEAAQEQVKEAKLLGLPGLDLQVSAQSSRPSDKSLTGASISTFPGNNHIEDYSAAFSLSWEADIWGKIRSRKEATIAAYLETSDAARAVQTRLITDIAQGYYNLLMLDEQMEVARENLALRDSTLQLTRLLKQATQVTELAVQQAAAQKQSTAAFIHQLEMDRSLQEHALSILTGKLPDKIARSRRLSQLKVPDTLSTGVPAAMVSRRPDVKASEMALVAANARAGIAKANLYPSLNITAAGGLNAFKASDWFNMPGALFGLVTGSVAQPIFQHRQLKTDWEVAKIEREEAVLSFRQSVLNAVGEVSDALVRINQLKQIQKITAIRVHTLEQAVSNAQLLFKSGMANYLEVITAQQNALQTELSLADVKRQRLSAVVELYGALGGGWKVK
jgi:NodT family efflux transporter outer membrane factor (OMF) lipoprotein